MGTTEVKVHTLDKTLNKSTIKGTIKSGGSKPFKIFIRDGMVVIDIQGTHGDKPEKILEALEANPNATFVYINTCSKTFKVYREQIIAILSKFFELRKLVLMQNNIKVIDEKLLTNNRIKILNLSFNNISYLPESLSNLNLFELVLSNNQLNIDCIRIISRIVNLEVLEMRNNKLAGLLPSMITELTSLETLILAENFLTGLPLTIFNMSSMKYINVSLNYLKYLPNTFADNIQNGCWYNFDGNNLIPEIKEVLKSPSKLKVLLSSPEYRVKYLTSKDETNQIFDCDDYNYRAFIPDDEMFDNEE